MNDPTMTGDAFDGIRLIPDARVWTPTYYAREFLALLANLDLVGKVVLDFGCGSGALAIFCAKAGARAIGSDINPYAIELSRKNAELNHVEVELVQSDRFHRLGPYKGQIDLIVANTPSLPGRPPHIVEREHADAYNENGSGRDLLDVVIGDGAAWCRAGGALLSCTNSEQGFGKSHELLQRHWSSFLILKTGEFEFDLPMLMKYRENWLSQELLFEHEGRIFHRVEFFLASR